MKRTLLTIILLLTLVTPGLASTKPNIIVILADDLGWKDLGCYGSETFQTPCLDRLAESGMRFTSAYAASCVCSPTRASIMTGKYPGRIDLTIWLGGRGGAPAADHLSLDEVTVAETLRDAGYLTAMVGKWHLGSTAYWPKQQGFEIAIGEPHAGSPAGGYYLPNRINLPGAKKGDYLTDRLTDEAVKIIQKNHDRPFFLYQAYHSVHTPIQGRPDLTKKHQARAQREAKQFNAAYAAMIESLDSGVGRIMDALREQNLLDRTVVIFTSDNGGFAYSRGKKNNVTDNSPLRFGKGYCYEGGHRVPWIVYYPPSIPRASVCDEPVITTDLYPTILKLAGLSALPQQHCDGVDLTLLLKDPSAKLPRDALYWHYPHNSPQGGTPSGAIRKGDWKLIEFFGDGRRDLYHLGRDLGEQNDLSQQEPQRLKELYDQLLAWREEVDAKLPPNARTAADQPLDSASDYVSRGMQRFRANDIAGSVRDFQRAAELEPRSAPHLWQLGISYYYLREFKKGQRLFESHRTVNPHDVENAAWHFLCVAAVDGVEAARKSLITIDTARDTRIPMSEVYQFYAGRGSEESVIEAANKADTQRARMYAHLYLGLYSEVVGDAQKAQKHMHLAAAAKLQNHYMHDVSKVHLGQRKWTFTSKPNRP